MHGIGSAVAGVASILYHTDCSWVEVLPRTQIAAGASFTRHPAQLYIYLGVFSSIRSWKFQQPYKWNSNSKRWLIQSSPHNDLFIPSQFDLLGAPEPVPVHVAVPVRTGTISQQAGCQNIFKVVCTHFNSPHTFSLYFNCYSVHS